MPAPKNKWVAKVHTDATHPPPGLFKKKASSIARALASKKVSPKGPASGMRMLNYFINRGGRQLTAERRKELEKAKSLLSRRVARDRKKREAAGAPRRGTHRRRDPIPKKEGANS